MLDLPFHEHSRSSDFIVELLAKRYDVTRIYLAAERDDEAACLAVVSAHQPDVVVLFQISFTARVLAQLGKPTVWVPMYDNVNRTFDDRFVDAASVGLSTFMLSDALARIGQYWKVPQLHARYYPEVGPEPDFDVGNNRTLFWYRGPIQPADVAPCFGHTPGMKLVIKQDPDPTHVDVARNDSGLDAGAIEVIQGFLPKAEYQELVASCGLYVAPRKAEGIGLSFLEAMCRGALVIAYDAPTMNEYIRHDVSGWLFTDARREPLAANGIATIRRNAYAQCVAGRQAWLATETRLLEFVAAAHPPSPKRNTAPWQTGLIRSVKRIRNTLSGRGRKA